MDDYKMKAAMDAVHEYLIKEGYIKDMYSFDYVKNICPGLVTRVTYNDYINACKVIVIYGDMEDDNNEKFL